MTTNEENHMDTKSATTLERSAGQLVKRAHELGAKQGREEAAIWKDRWASELSDVSRHSYTEGLFHSASLLLREYLRALNPELTIVVRRPHINGSWEDRVIRADDPDRKPRRPK
jgi:hypothetical protein